MRYDVQRTTTYTEVEWITVDAENEEAAMTEGCEQWDSGEWGDHCKSEIVDVIGDAEWSVEVAA
jgi:hypothetical protein